MRFVHLMVSLGLLAHAAHAGPAIQYDVVVSPERFRQSCYPTIERLADDRLLCVFSAIDASTANKMVVAAVTSADHGRTWSEPRVLIDTPDQYDYDPNIVVIGKRVIVSSTTTPKGEAISTSRTIAVRSEDNAQTWSKPYDIAMNHRYTSGKINNGIVLRDQSVLFGYTWEAQLEKVKRLPSEGDMIERSGVMISRDQGETWTNGGDVIDDKLKDPSRKAAISGICEPAIVECSDGSIYMLARTGVDHLYESRSKDGGRTWTHPVASALAGHNAPAALCRFKGKRPGIFVVWNNSPKDRWPLCAAVSFDEAKTWSTPITLADTPGFECSYPGCTQAADGKLIALWQQAKERGEREIRMARLDPEIFTTRGNAITTQTGGSMKTRRLVLFGDSTTAPRPGVRIFETVLEAELPRRGLPAEIINAGVPANDTQQARQRLEHDVLSRKPDIVTVWFGLNDSAIHVWEGKTKPRVSVDRYRENLRFIVQQLKDAGIKTILMTPNPVTWAPEIKELYSKPPYRPEDPDGWNVLLKDYVQAVRDVAAEEKVVLVDVYRIFHEVPAAEWPSLTTDGMHPSDKGQRIVADELLKILMGPRL